MAIGLLLGFALAWQLHDPHTAAAERLRGTVPWSDVESRQFVFDADGVVRDPLEGDTIYYVTGGWQDVAGVIHGSSEFPECLMDKTGESLNGARQRVELDAIHQDIGGPQKTNFAVFVRCLG